MRKRKSQYLKENSLNQVRVAIFISLNVQQTIHCWCTLANTYKQVTVNLLLISKVIVQPSGLELSTEGMAHVWIQQMLWWDWVSRREMAFSSWWNVKKISHLILLLHHLPCRVCDGQPGPGDGDFQLGQLNEDSPWFSVTRKSRVDWYSVICQRERQRCHGRTWLYWCSQK